MTDYDTSYGVNCELKFKELIFIITNGLFSSNKDNWCTPRDLFDFLDQKYHFTLDPCSDPSNYLCYKHFTANEDGLKQNWSNDIVFMNPPYGREIGKWVKKAYESNTTVMCLLPARTDTKWFHDYCLNGTIYFFKGRLKFSGSKNSAPFPSMLVLFERRNKK